MARREDIGRGQTRPFQIDLSESASGRPNWLDEGDTFLTASALALLCADWTSPCIIHWSHWVINGRPSSQREWNIHKCLSLFNLVNAGPKITELVGKGRAAPLKLRGAKLSKQSI